ncbi:MAG: alpha/beta hydrolase family protein [Phycisphaerales bacterium JB052]
MLLRLILMISLSTLTACRAVQAPMGLAHSGSHADTTASTDSNETVTDNESGHWPARWGNDIETRGVIIDLDPSTNLRAVHYSRYHQGRSTPQDYEDAAQLASGLGIESGFKFKVEGPGSFVFVEPLNNDEPRRDPPDLAFKYVSAREAAPEGATIDEDQDHVAIERTWFTFKNPRPDRDALGTIVLIPGMFGTPEPIVEACERYWHNRGYAVLRMLSHPSRFTQHLNMPYLDGHTDSVAKRIASSADQRIAECAYATRAAIDHAFRQNDSLNDRPVVLVGMSGGAMALPSVYAYDPDRYDAAVLIAGGANFMRIMIESNYRDWIDAITIDFDPLSDDLGNPAPELIDTLCERYLEYAKLDAYHTAPMLQDTPVLILHANNDKAVPAETGELLYERLGRPERWTYPLGHELIFAGLPLQVPKIDRWLTEQLIDADQPMLSD